MYPSNIIKYLKKGKWGFKHISKNKSGKYSLINEYLRNNVTEQKNNNKEYNSIESDSICEFAEKIVNDVSTITAMIIDDRYPIKNSLFKKDHDKLALLKDEIKTMLLCTTVQLFEIYKSQFLDECAVKIVKSMLQKEHESVEWVQSFINEKCTRVNNDEIMQNVKKSMSNEIGSKFYYYYNNYSITYINTDIYNTPCGKASNVILEHFYKKYNDKKKAFILDTNMIGQKCMVEYLQPILNL